MGTVRNGIRKRMKTKLVEFLEHSCQHQENTLVKYAVLYVHIASPDAALGASNLLDHMLLLNMSFDIFLA
jgi:hypothetical protein